MPATLATALHATTLSDVQIANLTLLHRDGRTAGHDCGPGNVLLDAWAARHLGQPYDDEGRFAGENAARFPQVQPGLRREPIGVVFSDPQMATVVKAPLGGSTVIFSSRK